MVLVSPKQIQSLLYPMMNRNKIPDSDNDSELLLYQSS